MADSKDSDDVKIFFWATREQRKRLRVEAAERDTTMRALITEGLELVMSEGEGAEKPTTPAERFGELMARAYPLYAERDRRAIESHAMQLLKEAQPRGNKRKRA